MCVGYTILDAVEGVVNDENWWLLNNQSKFNALINGEYLSNIRDAPDQQYLHVQCNSGVTYTNTIGDLPGYSNTVWYNPNGTANTRSLGLVHKNHLVRYNSQYGNKFVINISQRPTFKMNKSGIFYHNMRHLLKKKNNAHIMVNNSRSPIPKMEEKKKHYTTQDVKRADCARQFQHITGQPVTWILHAVDNKILHNLPILGEDYVKDEDIYGTSVPHYQGKTVRHKV